MPRDHLEIAARFAQIAAEPGGARTHSQRVLEELKGNLPAPYGFVCIEAADTEKLDVLAAVGLDATAFRRLEARAASSALLRIFDMPEPMGLLVHDEPTLDFLAVEN